MPIDSNIALGVRPIEQPNMLAQYGQVMAIKAAQQEMEGNEGYRNALAGGMEPTDPRILQYGRPGRETFKAAGEGKIKQLEAGKKQSELLGNIFGGVMQDPSSGPAAVAQLVKMNLIKPEEAQQVMAQAGNDPEAWKKIASPYYQQSIDATKRFQDETERWKANLQAQVTREGHGVQMYGHNVTATNAANLLDFNKSKRSVIPMEGGYGTTGYKGDILPVTGYGETPAVVSANDLARQVAPQQTAGNVNAFNASPATGAPIAVTAAPVAATPANVPRPPITAVQQKERAIVEKLPEAIAMNQSAIQKIDQMIGGVDAKGNPLKGAAGQPHPGLDKATGFGGGAMRFFSGTEGKNFEIRHKEVLSQAFLDAFEALKGGGAITEKEGEKATAARTRMDLAQDKKEYMEAAREYQDVLRRGIATAQQKLQRSGGGTATPAAAKTITRTGTIDGRKVVQYSDGSVDYGD